LQFLGKSYIAKTIDFEEGIYQDLGNYDIEISYSKSPIFKEKGYKVYVWCKNPLVIIKKFKAT